MFPINVYVVLKGCIRVCLIIVNHVYFLTYLSWVLILYPLRIFGCSGLFNKIEGEMMLGLIKMVTMWNEWAGYEVLEAGDDITPCLEERSLVLVNHQSPGDAIILFSAFVGWHQILPNAMWIMDHFIKYSTIGIVSSIRKDFFIFQGKAMRNESLKALAEHIRNFYLPLKRKWLILFPEGGLLCKRKMSSQKYGNLHNLPHLELVTIPRVGALKVIINELMGEVPEASRIRNYEVTHELKYILDVTIGYPQGKPLGLLSIIFGDAPPCKIVIFYRLFLIDEIPVDDEGMKEWILSKWVEKEKLLADFYDTGEFPLKPNSQAPRPVRQNFLSYCTLHLIFLLATTVLYKMFQLSYHY